MNTGKEINPQNGAQLQEQPHFQKAPGNRNQSSYNGERERPPAIGRGLQLWDDGEQRNAGRQHGTEFCFDFQAAI